MTGFAAGVTGFAAGVFLFVTLGLSQGPSRAIASDTEEARSATHDFGDGGKRPLVP
jgi:hypothetical protein